jgi:hypothetical protein
MGQLAVEEAKRFIVAPAVTFRSSVFSTIAMP